MIFLKKPRQIQMCQIITVEKKKIGNEKANFTVYLFVEVLSNEKWSFMAWDIDFGNHVWNFVRLPWVCRKTRRVRNSHIYWLGVKIRPNVNLKRVYIGRDTSYLGTKEKIRPFVWA